MSRQRKGLLLLLLLLLLEQACHLLGRRCLCGRWVEALRVLGEPVRGGRRSASKDVKRKSVIGRQRACDITKHKS